MVAIRYPWTTQSDDEYVHLERYVNDGSPSGYTEIHRTSDAADPFRGNESFPLLEFSDKDCDIQLLGRPSAYLDGDVNYAHPDSAESAVLAAAGRVLTPSEFVVSPVAGGRTMLVRTSGTSPGYIKLTYDVSRIGRVDRQLSLHHCLSSVEVSETLERALDTGALGDRCALLREPRARVSMLDVEGSIYEWGTIFRERAPYPLVKEFRAVVPGFSLFGSDRRDESHKPLICQFIALGGHDPKAYLMDLTLLIVDCYWRIVVTGGLHIECHGQNCLFEILPDLKPGRFIVKDMDSVDKDLPLQKFLGVDRIWKSSPYMCMDESVYYYPIRASYMYDFKLGEYLLAPLIGAVVDAFGVDSKEIDDNIKHHVQTNYLPLLPPSYFPEDGCWYDCDDTERMPGARREYFAHPNPRFR